LSLFKEAVELSPAGKSGAKFITYADLVKLMCDDDIKPINNESITQSY
jgi:hypothetical protein